MEALGLLLFGIGLLIFVIGGFWFLFVVFIEGVMWGLACIFLPFVSLIFLFMHWDRAKQPFLLQLAGSVSMVIGALIAGGSV